MGWAGRPVLRVVDGSGAQDAVVRRQRFEAAHPEVTIVRPGTARDRWRAVVPPGLLPGDRTRTTLGSWDLEGLMNQLDGIYPAGGGTPHGSPG
jgi:hypothetical protein